MKMLQIVPVIAAMIFTVNMKALSGNIGKELINYEIEAIENINLGSDVEKVWNLTYEGSENPITVIKRNTSDGSAFIVSSKFFEVCYMCGANGFGARSVKKAWSSVPNQINSVILNSQELKKQQVISPSKVDDEKALGLIASFLPNLLNEQYLHLLN
ncbi:MAG TPA: hypothetical protein VFD91_04380 [Mariniphaga sp.]|nr:hypothetical protein [Mariniphaga sp.]